MGWWVFCLAHCYPFLLSSWWDPLVYLLYTFGSPMGASFDEYIPLLLIKIKKGNANLLRGVGPVGTTGVVNSNKINSK